MCLFTDSKKKTWTKEMVLRQLKEVGADSCQFLFIHTDLMFGMPNKQLKRKEYLQALYEILLELKVPTLMFPAFTYSFQNHEDFDVRNSRTSMGALIEFIRKQPDVYRSLDPMLSVIAVGERADIVLGDPGCHCFGPDSCFNRLHHEEGVKFLFFGADFAEYFTYIHFIEKIMDVPYRFDMCFNGIITDYDGHSYEHAHAIHTQCGGVTLAGTQEFKADLLAKGMLKTAPLGDAEVACIAERDVFAEATRWIEENPFGFVLPYTQEDLTHEYTFGKDGARISHC